MTPTGIGLYLTRAAYADGVDRRAAKAKACRARWVALCVGGDDGWRPRPENVRTVRDAYQAHGLAVHVWQLDPAGAKPADQAAWLIACSQGCAGVILDIELAWKGRREDVRAYVSTMAAHCVGLGLALGVTSYPVASMHPTMPWTEMRSACAWGGPQIYRSAERPTLARRALSEWRAAYPAGVLPHLASYDVSGSPDKQAPQQRRHLALADTAPGLAIWSDPSLDAQERAVLAAYSDKRGW